METTSDTTTTTTFERAQQLLTEAGFSFTVVDRCPDPGCEACRPMALRSAA